jgi:death on curing protein
VKAWRWIDADVIIAVHDRQLAEHGGATGTRKRRAVDAALARPKNTAAYGDPDAAALAASYAWGIAANHGFADGTKRTAWVAARLFLADNGYVLAFDQLEAVQIMRHVAGKTMTEEQLAGWLRKRLA